MRNVNVDHENINSQRRLDLISKTPVTARRDLLRKPFEYTA